MPALRLDGGQVRPTKKQRKALARARKAAETRPKPGIKRRPLKEYSSDKALAKALRAYEEQRRGSVRPNARTGKALGPKGAPSKARVDALIGKKLGWKLKGGLQTAPITSATSKRLGPVLTREYGPRSSWLHVDYPELAAAGGMVRIPLNKLRPHEFGGAKGLAGEIEADMELDTENVWTKKPWDVSIGDVGKAAAQAEDFVSEKVGGALERAFDWFRGQNKKGVGPTLVGTKVGGITGWEDAGETIIDDVQGMTFGIPAGIKYLLTTSPHESIPTLAKTTWEVASHPQQYPISGPLTILGGVSAVAGGLQRAGAAGKMAKLAKSGDVSGAMDLVYGAIPEGVVRTPKKWGPLWRDLAVKGPAPERVTIPVRYSRPVKLTDDAKEAKKQLPGAKENLDEFRKVQGKAKRDRKELAALTGEGSTRAARAGELSENARNTALSELQKVNAERQQVAQLVGSTRAGARGAASANPAWAQAQLTFINQALRKFEQTLFENVYGQIPKEIVKAETARRNPHRGKRGRKGARSQYTVQQEASRKADTLLSEAFAGQRIPEEVKYALQESGLDIDIVRALYDQASELSEQIRLANLQNAPFGLADTEAIRRQTMQEFSVEKHFGDLLRREVELGQQLRRINARADVLRKRVAEYDAEIRQRQQFGRSEVAAKLEGEGVPAVQAREAATGRAPKKEYEWVEEPVTMPLSRNPIYAGIQKGAYRTPIPGSKAFGLKNRTIGEHVARSFQERQDRMRREIMLYEGLEDAIQPPSGRMVGDSATAQFLTGSFLDTPNDLFRLLAIGGPGYIRNLPAQLIIEALERGVLTLRDSYNLLKTARWTPEERGLLMRTIHQGKAQGMRGFEEALGEAGTFRPLAPINDRVFGAWGKVVDMPTRGGALMGQFARSGFSPDDVRTMLRSILDDSPESVARQGNLEALTRVGREANEAMVDFGRAMNRGGIDPFMRRAAIFWPWMKGSAYWTGRMVREHPTISALMANTGLLGTEYRNQELGPHPSYLWNAIPMGTEEIPGFGEVPRILNATALNPFTSPAELLGAGWAFGTGEGPKNLAPVEQLSFAAQLLFAGLAGRDPSTFAELEGSPGMTYLGDFFKRGSWPAQAVKAFRPPPEDQSNNLYLRQPDEGSSAARAARKALLMGSDIRNVSPERMAEEAEAEQPRGSFAEEKYREMNEERQEIVAGLRKAGAKERYKWLDYGRLKKPVRDAFNREAAFRVAMHNAGVDEVISADDPKAVEKEIARLNAAIEFAESQRSAVRQRTLAKARRVAKTSKDRAEIKRAYGWITDDLWAEDLRGLRSSAGVA